MDGGDPETMERNKNIRAYFMWASLVLGLLLASAACGSRSDGGRQESSATAGVASRAAEAGSTVEPEPPTDVRPVGTAEVQAATADPHGTSEPEPSTAEMPLGTADVQIVTEEPEVTSDLVAGSNPSGRFPAREDRSGQYACRWEITFEENFTGENLDASRWDTGYKAGDKEAQYYVEDAFELADGILKIRAEERQVGDRKYASGILTTQGKFDQQFGRFVVRAKLPAGQGLWPAFWLMPSSGGYPPEIDVFEILGHEPDTVYMSSHWRDDSGRYAFETRGFKGPDFSRDFHTFEVEWEKGQIVWRVDGIERSRERRGIPEEPMFLLLNLAVGGEWPGYPDDSTPFPSYLEVDYVRAYTWICPEITAEDLHKEDLHTE